MASSSWGGRFSNGDNITIIDADYRNLSLRHVETVTESQDLDNFNSEATSCDLYKFSVTSTVPIVAVRSSSLMTVLGIENTGTDTWGITLGGESFSSGSPSYAYVFDTPRGHSLPNWGMVVWDADGDVAFQSNESYMRVVGHTGDTLSSGTYAGIVSFPQTRVQVTNEPPQFQDARWYATYYRLAAKSTNTGITSSYLQIGHNSGPLNSGGRPSPQDPDSDMPIVAIDVGDV